MFRLIKADIEDALKLLKDLPNIGIYIAQDNRFKFVNDEMTRITGFSREELFSMNPMDLVHPEDRERVREEAIKMLKGEKDTPYEFRALRKDGSIGWVMAKAISVKFRGRDAVLVNFMDITRQKETEEILKKILDFSPVGICLAENRIIKWANPEMAKMFGYKDIKEMEDLPARNLYASDDEYERIGKILYTVLRDGVPAQTEALFRRKDGSTFWGIIKMTTFDPEAPQKRVIAAVMDISERKRLEKELFKEKELFEVTLMSIGDGVICTDKEGKVTFINKTAQMLTGWSEEEAIGKPLKEVFHIVNEFTRERCEDPVEKVLKTGKVVGLANNTVLISKDGTERILADSGAPIKDKEGNIIGVVLVFRDVTAQRKLESETARMERLESIGILAGGIAHDFNNLLMGMLGNISLLKTRIPPDNSEYRYLEDLERVVIQAKSLSQQLLTFSKGGKPIRKPLNMAELIHKTVRFALSGSDIRCEFYIQDGLWMVNGDENQLSQVISNIVINSRQAMPSGGRLIVKAENVSIKDESIPLKEGDYVKITIQDTGMGIPKEYLNRVFDPYFTTKQKGSGLGLTVAYSIVKDHEGHITIDSELGKGTIVEIYLPAILEKKEEKALKAEGLNILVMDDEEIVLSVLEEMLKALGHKVKTARNGEEAIDLYKRERFDLVILDLTVPAGMGGKETMERLLEIDPNVKAIVSSGYSNDPIMSEYEKHGFKAVIAKPYGIEELKEAIDKALS